MLPAARLGDLTVHGGVIIMGSPTVLVNARPAARVTDMHVCPMITGLVPHVGGPIIKGSGTVLINGLPAARITDLATCIGPIDVIALGSFNTMIGG
jgi:uncharacterized Zn-binding protein involved in type VI secretion